MAEKHIPKVIELKTHALTIWSLKIIIMQIATKAMRRDSWIMSFLIDLNGIREDMNLKTVMEIQNIEL